MTREQAHILAHTRFALRSAITRLSKQLEYAAAEDSAEFQALTSRLEKLILHLQNFDSTLYTGIPRAVRKSQAKPKVTKDEETIASKTDSNASLFDLWPAKIRKDRTRRKAG